MLLTDRRQAAGPLDEVVRAAIAGGARRIVLREKDLPRHRRAALAGRLRALLAPVGGRLIVAGTDPLGGRAVHLAAADPAPDTSLDLIGRSCHTLADLDRLDSEHYVFVSPVFPTATKPGYGPVLGTAGLAALCARTDRPVLALGGIGTPAQAAACLAAGAVGVAVLGAVLRARDPAAVVAALLREVPA